MGAGPKPNICDHNRFDLKITKRQFMKTNNYIKTHELPN
ncbi:hypothetical protein MuYL_2258 [Mucilaginibacter xinganensis]|uniref:Uncharacterized protein n=1 Tax=Mucilaginibacter xinganensis TaxID=1234841 RepID=A0A223NW97_9SPHI|nr:hypothetical protein MuYL_2258 [Mucilaginibacter xinganensis]